MIYRDHTKVGRRSSIQQTQYRRMGFLLMSLQGRHQVYLRMVFGKQRDAYQADSR